MKQTVGRNLFIALIISTLLRMFAPLVLAAPNALDCNAGQALILSPQSGATVFGIVQIEGTASLGDAFVRYELAVAPNGTQAWGNIGQSTQQVVNGQLGVWDSAAVPDGTYTVRLRVVDTTSNYCEKFSTNVRVRNSAPPTPTVEISPTPEETEAPPIQNAVPTPLPTIPAPEGTGTPGATPAITRAGPTRTPAPGSSGIGGIEIGGIVDAIGDLFGALLRTFMFGVLTMAGIVALIGVIYFVRRVL